MYGSLLKINLTTGEVRNEHIPEDYIRDYIGASGLAARLLWDALDPSIDPLDPRSPMLWITGPLTGTGGPTTGRFTICARSPQTGLWGESNIGGFVGPELRCAGYDAVWVTGRAPEPVYLWIHDGQAELRPAVHLWGQADTYAVQDRIREEVGEPRAKVASIGLAGENKVPFAAILSDHGRAAARTGMGALMGSKNLKALAVRGSGQLVVDSERYRKLRVAANKDLLQQNMTDVLQQTGTAGAADFLQYMGDMPQKYWTAPTFDGAYNISGSQMADTILSGVTACQGCVIKCGREVTIKDGPYATSGPAKGPEYETVCAFGSQLLVDDLEVITALGDRCDRLGLDTISAGNTIALAYLLYERGFISAKDTGGVELHWGDASPCFQLLDQIAGREGFGARLAMGSRWLAAHFGAPELAVEVNNLEIPMHDPRAFTGQALAYVTSPRGGCHNQSDFFQVEVGGAVDEIGVPVPPDRLAEQGKAQYVARHQHWRTLCNSLVICYFAVVQPSSIAELYSAYVGRDVGLDELMRAGERAWNLKRLYNLRLGFSPEAEKLPGLLLEPLHEGGQAGHVPDMDLLLDEYYAASGWDRATGWPTRQKLEELDLLWAGEKTEFTGGGRV
jgi:aldehyde:ferredoxin oxidoreductase